MLIRNYGLLWKRDDVFWGWQKKKGHLYGVERHGQAPVDFREQLGIYALYCSDKRTPVYVGQTGRGNDRLFKRLKAHTKNHFKDAWTHFSWFGLRKVLNNNELSMGARAKIVTSAAALNHIEAIVIAVAGPELNKIAGPFAGACEYLQYVDASRAPLPKVEGLEHVDLIVEDKESAPRFQWWLWFRSR